MLHILRLDPRRCHHPVERLASNPLQSDRCAASVNFPPSLILSIRNSVAEPLCSTSRIRADLKQKWTETPEKAGLNCVREGMSRDRLCLSRAQSEPVEVTIDVVFSRRKRFEPVPLFIHNVTDVVSRACLEATCAEGARCCDSADMVNMDIADDSTGHKLKPPSSTAGLRDQLACF